MPHSVASDLGLHCLPMSYKKDARLIWVNVNHLLTQTHMKYHQFGRFFCNKTGWDLIQN